MKKKTNGFIFSAMLLGTMFVACNGNQQASSDKIQTKIDDQTTTVNDLLTHERLRRFDTLDFQFYSNQQWDSLAVSHDKNIKVYYPDGTTSTGLFPQHIDMLKPLFVFAPDTKITEHPVKFGAGDWTTVIGTMEGTFSQPMQQPGGGKTIPPTGKKFKLSMCTVGHWNGGKMIEEYLFWDNQSLMKQIGLGK